MKLKISILIILTIFISLTSCSKKEASKTFSTIQITDYAERKISLDKPAERIIVMADNAFQIVKELGSIEKVVGLDSKTKGYWDLYLMH